MKFGSVLRGFVVGLPVGVVVVDYFGYIAKVEGVSMQPALNPGSDPKTNDFVLLNKWSVRNFDIKRGDVVSLKSPRDPNQKIIKRVVGLEGETLKFVKIPRGHCWVEGDNHPYSMDSNLFGPVAVGLITAKATHIVWPIRRWRRIATELAATDVRNVSTRADVSWPSEKARIPSSGR